MNSPATDIKKLLAAIGLELSYNFYYGTRIELDNSLINKGKTTTYRALKYPCVWLLSNYSESINTNDEFFSTVDFVLVFMNVTKLNSDSEKRKTDNIDLVLRPMVNAFLKKMYETKYKRLLKLNAGEKYSFQLNERSLYGYFENGKHVLSDNPTDAIELRMKIKIQNSECTL